MRLAKYLFIFCLVLLPTILLAQANGTSRTFDTTKLQDWKSEKVFQYDRIKQRSFSIWDIITHWINKIWRQIMSNETSARGFWIILVILSVLLITYIVKRYSGNTKGIWSKSDRSNQGDLNWEEEDIHSIDFDSQIAQAISQGNFRLAIRLRYLYLLKILDQENYIHWQLGKTNHDYIKEIYQKSPEGAFPLFQKISLTYEYAWYGDHGATKEDYDLTVDLFDHIRNNSFTSKKVIHEGI